MTPWANSWCISKVSVILAYDTPDIGEALILIVQQVVYIPYLAHNLMSTFQMRLNDVMVDETPKFQYKRTTECDLTICMRAERDHIL
jgi:hypothetical protein